MGIDSFLLRGAALKKFSKRESRRELDATSSRDAHVRKRRQAESLRDNLLKRKRQQQNRADRQPEKTPDRH